MMAFIMLKDTVKLITYKPGWALLIDSLGSDRYAIYWRWTAPDADHPTETIECEGRSWLLPETFNERDIITTALAAAIMCEEHEAREAFRVSGVRIFSPHGSLL